MKIPREWTSEICNKLIEQIVIEKPEVFVIVATVDNYVNSQFNLAWTFSETQSQEFKKFFIATVVHQCNPWTHGLTCGIDSEHALLVPRIDSENKCYLICPSCGWVQYNSPIGRNIC